MTLSMLCSFAYSNDITPNTEFFSLQKFSYKNPNGQDYLNYQASGFYPYRA